jgi:hypothetical protein
MLVKEKAPNRPLVVVAVRIEKLDRDTDDVGVDAGVEDPVAVQIEELHALDRSDRQRHVAEKIVRRGLARREVDLGRAGAARRGLHVAGRNGLGQRVRSRGEAGEGEASVGAGRGRKHAAAAGKRDRHSRDSRLIDVPHSVAVGVFELDTGDRAGRRGRRLVSEEIPAGHLAARQSDRVGTGRRHGLDESRRDDLGQGV